MLLAQFYPRSYVEVEVFEVSNRTFLSIPNPFVSRLVLSQFFGQSIMRPLVQSTDLDRPIILLNLHAVLLIEEC
jgi:hypothetical protein